MKLEAVRGLKIKMEQRMAEDAERAHYDATSGVMTYTCSRCKAPVAFWRSRCPTCWQPADRRYKNPYDTPAPLTPAEVVEMCKAADDRQAALQRDQDRDRLPRLRAAGVPLPALRPCGRLHRRLHWDVRERVVQRELPAPAPLARTGTLPLMNPVQYIILNKSLPMSTGKAAAQAAHASQMGLLAMVDNDTTRSPFEKSIANRWMRAGHYAKVVLEAHDLAVAERYLNDRGFKTALIIDEGRTEVKALTPTVIGVEVLDKDQPHVRETFSAFRLYTDSNPSEPSMIINFSQGKLPVAPMDLLPDGGFVSKDEVLRRRRIKEMFKRVRERLGEAELDESNPHLDVDDGNLEGPGFPWPPTVRQT